MSSAWRDEGMCRRGAAGGLCLAALALVGSLSCAVDDNDGSLSDADIASGSTDGDAAGGSGGDVQRDADAEGLVDAETGSDPLLDRGDSGPVLDLGGDSDGLRAFPGAQGFGTETPGGRGGRVFVVDTLDWEGRGSLSEALLAREPRIIVFRVSGVIEVTQGVALEEAHSYLTVAGQTSPGGITLSGSPGYFIENYQTNFHDAVFRFLRFRGQGNYDNVAFNTAHHLVFDHCDFSGGSDETFDITHGHDVTVQWSTINNSDSAGQNYGALIAYYPTANFSFHHNLFAHHTNRCAPHMHWTGGVPDEGAVIDFRNNVVYNCSFDAVMYVTAPDGGGERISFNLVGNTFRTGPDTPTSSAYGYSLPEGSSVHETDTQYDGLPIFSDWEDHVDTAEAATAPTVLTLSANDAYEVVLDRVGAFPRDAMNARTIEEVRNRTGTMGRLDDTLLTEGAEAPVDADLDGMADEWEANMGLDSQDAADNVGDLDGDGYTNVEEYINELADALIAR